MLLVPLLASLLPQASAPHDSGALPDAAALLDRREATLGPIEARTRPHGLVIEGTFTMEGQTFEAHFEELHLVGADGERVRFALNMGGWGTTTQGTDGRVSWTTDPGFGVAIKEGEEQMPVRRLWAIQRSAPWRTLYAGARTLGAVERDGRGLWELEMQPKEGKPTRWYLDRATNELARVAVVYPGPMGEALPMEFTLDDWRAVDGVLYPHRRGQEVLGGLAPETGTVTGEAGSGTTRTAEAAAPVMKMLYTCTSIRHEALDPARVAPPPEVLAAIEDTAKRTPRPSADPSECRLETKALQPVASVRLEIDASKVSETLAVTLTEVMGAITAQGAEMAGPPFARYHAIDTAKSTIDLEAGIPVRKPIAASGRVRPGELPAGRVAMTWHVGSYHQLQQSYDRLRAWLDGQKLTPRGGFWEVYWTDPSLEPDPSTWRTQIFWPVE